MISAEGGVGESPEGELEVAEAKEAVGEGSYVHLHIGFVNPYLAPGAE